MTLYVTESYSHPTEYKLSLGNVALEDSSSYHPNNLRAPGGGRSPADLWAQPLYLYIGSKARHWPGPLVTASEGGK